MAAEPKKTTSGEDLSMEEILQSIRKIIADEDSDGAPAQPSSDIFTQSDSNAFGSDVLELTDMVVNEPTQSMDVLQGIDDAFGVEKPIAQPEVFVESAPIEPEPVMDLAMEAPMDEVFHPATDRLISDSAAIASAASFKKVIQTHKATTPMPHFRNGETIEDLVLETLKPILKEWLDTNLPSMVERIVEREIRKLVD